MSSFVIKIIAIISMTLDHVNYLVNSGVSLNIIGRIAFPLYCFQVVVGYEKTKSIKKYLLRMMLFAIISQIPYYLFTKSFENEFSLNVIFTLCFGLISIYIYDLNIFETNGKFSIIDKNNKNYLAKYTVPYDIMLLLLFYMVKILVLMFIVIISDALKLDYSAWGIMLILFIHMCYPFKNNINLFGKIIKTPKIIVDILFIIGMIIFTTLKYIEYFRVVEVKYILLYSLFTFLPTIIMLLYNGKKGYGVKYFFYIYYPIHFIILLFVKAQLNC